MSYLEGRSDGSQEWVRRWRGRFTVCKCQTINLIMTIKLYIKIPKQIIKKRLIWYRNKWNLKSH